MKPEELADEIERAHQAILDEAGGSGERAWRRARFGQVAEDNFPTILSALRRVEKLEAALEKISGMASDEMVHTDDEWKYGHEEGLFDAAQVARATLTTIREKTDET